MTLKQKATAIINMKAEIRNMERETDTFNIITWKFSVNKNIWRKI